MLAHKRVMLIPDLYSTEPRIWCLAVKKYALLIVLKTSLREIQLKNNTLSPQKCYPHFPYPLTVSKNPLNSIICISASSSQFFNFEETTSNFSLKEKWMKIFSHFKATSHPVIFYCKGRKLVKIKKTQFHPWHWEMESYKHPPHHTAGGAAASVLSACGQ